MPFATAPSRQVGRRPGSPINHKDLRERREGLRGHARWPGNPFFVFFEIFVVKSFFPPTVPYTSTSEPRIVYVYVNGYVYGSGPIVEPPSRPPPLRAPVQTLY